MEQEITIDFIYSYVRNNFKRRKLTDDTIQDIVIKIYYSLHTYDPNKGKFEAWAGKIVKNHHIDAYRTSQKEKTQSINGPTFEMQVIDSNSIDPQNQLIQKEEFDELNKYIDNLPETLKSNLIAYLNRDEFDWDQTSINNKVKLFRARKILKKFINKKNYPYL